MNQSERVYVVLSRDVTRDDWKNIAVYATEQGTDAYVAELSDFDSMSQITERLPIGTCVS